MHVFSDDDVSGLAVLQTRLFVLENDREATGTKSTQMRRKEHEATPTTTSMSLPEED